MFFFRGLVTVLPGTVGAVLPWAWIGGWWQFSALVAVLLGWLVVLLNLPPVLSMLLVLKVSLFILFYYSYTTVCLCLCLCSDDLSWPAPLSRQAVLRGQATCLVTVVSGPVTLVVVLLWGQVTVYLPAPFCVVVVMGQAGVVVVLLVC